MAKEVWIGSKEIRERLSCGKTYANELLHMFEARGQLYKVGKLLMVKEKVFNQWMEIECKVGR